MKKTIWTVAMATIVIALLIACSGNGTEVERTTLITENFAAQHPEWEVSKDTTVKDFILKGKFKSGHEIPFRLKWTTAVDSAGVTQIAFCQFDRMGGSDKVAVDSVVLSELTSSRSIYTIVAGLKPAQPTKETYWQGFRIDFSAQELIIAVGIDELQKP